ncbi:conjugal transfer protein TraK (plasmid) [Hymenobacter sp. BRD128]|uniref:conjugal transfer protein TraK n=1 Tax=Hymenobacter sp. BRD128 TaxID=2675878 RepID=UPI00156603B3|nr:conjugal transfer protein TraK [Hymenobacter sp. BRD128]QKG59058.1 conjugal transfer protein TraK [Hymenobacter sp. BRD128]
MQFLTVLSAVTMLVIATLAGFMTAHAYEVSGRRVYVVGPGGTFSALLAAPEAHTEFEVRNLVRQFMQTMYAHDQYTFKQHLDAALPLIDDTDGRRIYAGFKKGQVFENYVHYGARQVLDVDSIVLQLKKRPFMATAYCRQRIFMGDQQSAPTGLAAHFNLIEVDRSEKNPYGLQLTNFDYLPYAPPVSKEEQDFLKSQAAERATKIAALKAAAGATAAPPAPKPAPAE